MREVNCIIMQETVSFNRKPSAGPLHQADMAYDGWVQQSHVLCTVTVIAMLWQSHQCTTLKTICKLYAPSLYGEREVVSSNPDRGTIVG